MTIEFLLNKIKEKFQKSKGGVSKIFIHSVQHWLPFDKIFDNGIIKLKDKSYLKVIKIKPINYNLKSNLEKESILNSYKIFLKTCNFDIQIIIKSKKQDLTEHFNKLEKIEENEDNIIKIKRSYIENLKELNSNNKADSKQFFILIKQSIENDREDICIEQLNDKYFKIKETLSRCGNKAVDINSIDEIKSFLKDFFYLENNNKI